MDLKKGLFILLLILGAQLLSAQQPDSSKLVMGIIQGNDTIITVRIKEIWVFPERKFSSKREQRYFKPFNRIKRICFIGRSP